MTEFTSHDHGPPAFTDTVETGGGSRKTTPAVDLPRKYFIEEVSGVYEQLGLPRMAGRVMGAFMVSCPPRLSLGDLTDMLQASKSSVSISLRLLMEVGVVQRVVSPGERREYYELSISGWLKHINTKFSFLKQMTVLTQKAIDLVGQDPDSEETVSFLAFMRDLDGMLAREIPQLVSRWLKDRPDMYQFVDPDFRL